LCQCATFKEKNQPYHNREGDFVDRQSESSFQSSKITCNHRGSTSDGIGDSLPSHIETNTAGILKEFLDLDKKSTYKKTYFYSFNYLSNSRFRNLRQGNIMGQMLVGKPVRRERLSDQVKNALKTAMIQGKLCPGDKLPPEDDIARQFDVSKATAREALREMEAQGLIEKHRGVHGGSFVARPGLDKMGDAVINSYQFGGLTPEELVEMRRILEPTLVALAAERCTDADLTAIRENIEAVETAITRGRQNQPKAIEFHRLVAEACHNRLISAVMEALVKVFEDMLAKIPMTLEDARGDLEYNKLFYKYLLEGRKDEARELMVRHMDSLSAIIERAKSSSSLEKI
jgi:GntR family transcriptional regulator, transcriptional repressor for pyruvate dehydrogenase complex